MPSSDQPAPPAFLSPPVRCVCNDRPASHPARTVPDRRETRLELESCGARKSAAKCGRKTGGLPAHTLVTGPQSRLFRRDTRRDVCQPPGYGCRTPGDALTSFGAGSHRRQTRRARVLRERVRTLRDRDSTSPASPTIAPHAAVAKYGVRAAFRPRALVDRLQGVISLHADKHDKYTHRRLGSAINASPRAAESTNRRFRGRRGVPAADECVDTAKRLKTYL